MTFSENSTRQLYVAKSLGTTGVGAISVGYNGTDIFFKYISPDGVVRTDIVPKANVTQAQAIKFDKANRSLTKYAVALDPTVNGGAPLANQIYIANLTFFEWGSLSYDDQYFKFAMVQATTGMTAEQFYTAMVASVDLNMQREEIPLITYGLSGVLATVNMATNTGITVTANGAGTVNNALDFAIASVSAATASVTVVGNVITASLTAANKTIADLKALISGDAVASTLITISGNNTTIVVAETVAVSLAGGTCTGFYIQEIEQPWTLGTKASEPLRFLIQASTITVAGIDVPWGITTTVPSGVTVLNGKTVADMEYFYMGERGDVYRGVGFPNIIHTAYQADPTIAYNFIELNYFYAGEGLDVQHSDKHITIVSPAVGADNATQIALTNSIVAAISAAGVVISALV